MWRDDNNNISNNPNVSEMATWVDHPSVQGAGSDAASSPSATVKEHIEALQIILNIASERDVSLQMEACKQIVQWDDFKAYFRDIPIGRREAVLHTQFKREVQVYKDHSDIKHRKYMTTDTILEMALRRTPTNNVLEMFVRSSKSYKLSKEIFDQMNTITLENEEWLDIRFLFDDNPSLLSNPPLLNQVCTIRHTWREDTFLSVAARRDPPVSMIKKLISYAPGAISMRDTPLYDWMPFVYALAYNAIPEVVEALIPPSETLETSSVLITKDVYNLTPLHWSLFYGTPAEAVKSLVDADASKESLLIEDAQGKKPFEVAISESPDMAIVEVLLPTIHLQKKLRRNLSYKEF